MSPYLYQVSHEEDSLETIHSYLLLHLFNLNVFLVELKIRQKLIVAMQKTGHSPPPPPSILGYAHHSPPPYGYQGYYYEGYPQSSPPPPPRDDHYHHSGCSSFLSGWYGFSNLYLCYVRSSKFFKKTITLIY